MGKIEDTGAQGTNTVNVPSRYLPALVAGLTYKLALKLPTLLQQLPVYKGEYNEQLKLAESSERSKTSLFARPKMARI